MQLALQQAQAAAEKGEVPVGAVVVRGGEVLAAAGNRREAGDATGHAELLALRAACEKLGSWRLSDCTLYVTLEPCAMCAGAIVNSRLARLVYGAADDIAGCCGSVIDILEMPFSHHPPVRTGVLAAESRALLQQFFAARREQRS